MPGTLGDYGIHRLKCITGESDKAEEDNGRIGDGTADSGSEGDRISAAGLSV